MVITYEYNWLLSLLKLVMGLNPRCVRLTHKALNWFFLSNYLKVFFSSLKTLNISDELFDVAPCVNAYFCTSGSLVRKKD